MMWCRRKIIDMDNAALPTASHTKSCERVKTQATEALDYATKI